jgi:hypothetical protein
MQLNKITILQQLLFLLFLLHRMAPRFILVSSDVHTLNTLDKPQFGDNEWKKDPS